MDLPYHSIKCLLCNDTAVVVVKADHGCTCAGNIYQPRCMQHLIKLDDSDTGRFEIVEDFRKTPPEQS